MPATSLAVVRSIRMVPASGACIQARALSVSLIVRACAGLAARKSSQPSPMPFTNAVSTASSAVVSIVPAGTWRMSSRIPAAVSMPAATIGLTFFRMAWIKYVFTAAAVICAALLWRKTCPVSQPVFNVLAHSVATVVLSLPT